MIDQPPTSGSIGASRLSLDEGVREIVKLIAEQMAEEDYHKGEAIRLVELGLKGKGISR